MEPGSLPAHEPINYRRAEESPKPDVGGELRSGCSHEGAESNDKARSSAVEKTRPKARHLGHIPPEQMQLLLRNCEIFINV